MGKRHARVMEKIIRVGFKSPTLTFEKDVSVNELLDIFADHVPLYEEAAAAAQLLGSVYDTGSYDGTDWSFWFVEREIKPVLH